MTVLTRSRMAITLTLVSLILLETHPVTLVQNAASDEPHGAACEREILKLGPRRPTVWREVTSPMITRHVGQPCDRESDTTSPRRSTRSSIRVIPGRPT